MMMKESNQQQSGKYKWNKYTVINNVITIAEMTVDN
jgi:hypothetical protein